MNSYYLEGYNAAFKDSDDGFSKRIECPYPKDSSMFKEWSDGYSIGLDDWYYSQYDLED